MTMKKSIINMLVVMVLLLACSIGFVACGKKEELKPEQIQGTWYSTTVVVEGRGEGDGTYTYARYAELKAKVDAGELSPTNLEYVNLCYAIVNYKALEDGQLKTKPISMDDAEYQDIATWKIENNKLVVTSEDEEVKSIDSNYNNGIVTIVVNFEEHENPMDESSPLLRYSVTYTLAKVA